MEKHEIRIILLHEFKLGRNATEAAQNINQAWGPNTLTDRTARNWFVKFRSGDFSLNDKEGRGHVSTVDNDVLKATVESNPQTTCKELSLLFGVSVSTIFDHLKAIGKVKKLDKWVPHELNEKQKLRRLEISSSLLQRHKNLSFLDRIVTCDEKWILYDNRRRSGQWLDEDEAPKHMPKPALHPKKIMITVWWSSAGIIHYEFLQSGQTITGDRYCQELDDFHKKLLILQPALANRKGPILLHDNARPHISKQVQIKINELGYEVLPHPPYSPDLAPTDYHFFKHLDAFVANKFYNSEGDLKNDVISFIESRSPEFCSIGINKLLERWEKCKNSDGNYFD